MANYGRYQTAQLQNAVGQALAGAEVYFLTQPADVQTLTPLATVYSNATGAGGAVTQPLITDGLGQFAAYLAPGVYTVVYVISTAGIFSYPDQNVAIGGGTAGTMTFDQIGTGTNTTATMGVGSGAVLAPTGSGIIQASQVQGVVVSATPPGTGQVLTATSPTTASWSSPSGSSGVTSLNTLAGALTLAVGSGLSMTSSGGTITISLTTAFLINSFTGGSTVEIGTSVVNPTFTASYSTTPASASITNSDSIDSPLNLSSPFTTGTVAGTFVHTSAYTTTFQLSATQGTTQTATQQILWEPRIFGGPGTIGATSSVTSSGTTAVLSTGSVLPSSGLGSEQVGEMFGPYSPSGQAIYLFLTGGSHTFIDAITGFPFAFNAPITVSFVNAKGVTVTMYLYQSTNPLYGTYEPKVAS